MKVGPWVIAASIALGLYSCSGEDAARPPSQASFAPALPASFVLPNGRRFSLREAGRFRWQGLPNQSATLTVYCAEGDFIIGEVRGVMLGLNGNTSSWSGRATVRMTDGTSRQLFNNEHPTLQSLSLMTGGADVIETNQPISDGIRAGLSTCGY